MMTSCFRFVFRPVLSSLALGMALTLGVALSLPGPAQAASRIKDIATFEGIRDNLLVGYGLVVGLNQTGDDLNNDLFTRTSLISMLERLGVGVDRDTNDLDSENVAAVMVTAVLPPFARQGNRVDVTISALGSASSLLGGTLVVTPLLGADGEVYAVSQGQVAVSGFEARGQAQTVTRGVPTSGRIPDGAIIEREINFSIAEQRSIKIALRNPDFTTARRLSDAINSFLGGDPAARMLDPGTVELSIPPGYRGDTVSLLTDIEQLRIEPDQSARVVIDERSGAIVIGEKVRISTVAIALGALTIRVTETPQVSQANPFAPEGATTEIVPRTQIEIDEGAERRFEVFDEGISLDDLVKSLNRIGVSPRDMITILQAVKAAGALQAELEFL